MSFLKLRWIVLSVFLLAASDSVAQTLARHNWYFGDTNRAIRFSRSDNTPTLLTNKVFPFGTGGSAVGSNPTNGDLMFYTNGVNIYDLTNTLMPNGNALNGQPNANQPVAISGVPGSPSHYYVFTNTASFTTGGTVFVTTVDMSASGNETFPEPPIGSVTAKNVPTGLTNRSEAMIVVPHADGSTYWLLSHQANSDTYTAVRIGPTGTLEAPVLSNNITGFPIYAGNFAYHAATGKIAVSPQSANVNVAILNFDNATGAFTLDQMVPNTASATAQFVYDTEWSPSGRFLYISRENQVQQFDTTTPSASLITVSTGTINRSYGLQLAPDTAIYHLYQATSGGPFLLGRFNDTDSLGTDVIHTSTITGFTGDFAGRQFPAFLPITDLGLTVTFTTDGTCQNTPITFYPTVTPAADSLVWAFGDGQGSSQWSPVHVYEQDPPPSGFNVSVTAYLNGQTATHSSLLPLTGFTLQLTLPQDTTACRCEFPPPVGDSCNNGPFSVTVEAEGGSPTYIWSNGDTGATLTPDSAGYYYVIATIGACQTHAGVNVREYDGVDQRANIWHFGEAGGIDFNEQPAVAIVGPLNTPEGCSTISDRNGEVIFSTDGVIVYRKDESVAQYFANGVPPGIPIAIPPGIGGENGATQSALIVPVPGDETLFYIFTTQQVHGSNTYELRYSLYDVKLDNGAGGLREYNQLLFTRSTERITSDGTWLVAHEYGNNSFRAYPISADGIGNPVISSIGSDHRVTEEVNGQGYMKFGTGILGVAFSSGTSSNALELFDFDAATGELSNFRSINLNANGQVYGLEFVGNKFFATVKSASTTAIREGYIDFQDNPVLIPNPAMDALSGELGAIQTGPDGTVYVAINNSNFLGTISVNGDTLQTSTFNPQGFQLAGGTRSRLGLPNFVQSISNATPDPSMAITGVCLGSPTEFEGIGTDPIDEFLWTFDGLTSTEQSFSHTFATAGPKLITLRITNRCGLDTLLTQTITIVNPPDRPTFLPPGQQPTVCNGPLTLQALPVSTPGLAYLWSTGETTFTIQVDRRQIVSVTITNPAGCTSTGSLFIVDNRPVINLGPDLTVCEDAAIPDLNAGNPNLDYVWVINGVTQSNTENTQSVNTTSPPMNPTVNVYEVTGTDNANGCTDSDTVTITINQTPDFTATPNTINCNTNDGEIELVINSPGGSRFAYTITGLTSGLVNSDTDQDIGLVDDSPIDGLAADTYTIRVEDQVSGCATTNSVAINTTSLSIISAVAQTPTCDPIGIIVEPSITNGQYRVINSLTGAVVVPLTFFTTPVGGTFTTTPVTVPGEYIVEIRNIAPPLPVCTATITISIISDPQVDVTLTYDACVDEVTNIIGLEVNPAAPVGSTYTWSGPNTGNVTTSSPLLAVPAPANGLHEYSVTVTSPGLCPRTVTVRVPVTNFNVDFNQTEACANQVTLTAVVDTPGSYTYRWYHNNNLIPGGSSIIVRLSDHVIGDEYRVVAIDAFSGCENESDNKEVFVNGAISVSLFAVSPCAGATFSIEATNIAGATYQWFRDDANGNPVIIPGQTTSTLTDTREGRYSVIATRNGCSSPVVYGTILFLQGPAGQLPARRFICNLPGNRECGTPTPNTCEFTLDAGMAITWQWSLDGIVLPGETSRTITVNEPGVYSVAMTNVFNCPGTDQTLVEQRCDPLLDVPNAFRPGSSVDANKTFYVFPTFVSPTNFQVFIFNRWGEMVYQSNQLDFKWDGTFRGNKTQLLPAGTYTYVIKYRGDLLTTGGDTKELRGGVVLLR